MPLDARAIFLELKKEILRRGTRQTFTGKGLSMFPNLLPGVTYTVAYVPIGRLAPGEVVVVRPEGAPPMAHRLVRREGPYLVTKGDACDREDAPHPPKGYLGKIESMRIGPLELRPSFTEPILRRIYGRPDPAFCLKAAAWARRLRDGIARARQG